MLRGGIRDLLQELPDRIGALSGQSCRHRQQEREQQEPIMGKGNNSQKRETKKPKKDASKKGAKEVRK